MDPLALYGIHVVIIFCIFLRLKLKIKKKKSKKSEKLQKIPQFDPQLNSSKFQAEFFFVQPEAQKI